MDIYHIKEICDELQLTTAKTGKENILKREINNIDFKNVLYFLLNPYITTGINEKKINKVINCPKNKIVISFENLLPYITENNTGKDTDLATVQQCIGSYATDLQAFMKSIITKTLRLGIDAKTVNKVYGNKFIPTFNVQLGTSIEKVNLKGDEWIAISRKMNGTRCCFCGNKFMTRQGKEYIGIEHIAKELIDMGYQDMFIDGELLYKNEEGLTDSEAFQIGTGIANSKNGDKTQLKFVVFDMLPLNEFETGQSNLTYSYRIAQLQEFQQSLEKRKILDIELVPMVYQGYDHSEIWKWLDYAEENDWEGVMLNLDTPYETKRTKNLIKVKKFYEIDLRCTAVNIADIGKYASKLGSITCKFGDNTVDVGSGFSDEQRDYYTKYPEEIIGKIIAIRYKEMTTSKTGNKSLQFPTLLAIRNPSDKSIADDE